jgi:hypothetical protein
LGTQLAARTMKRLRLSPLRRAIVARCSGQHRGAQAPSISR